MPALEAQRIASPSEAVPKKLPGNSSVTTAPAELPAPRAVEPTPRPSVIAPLAAERYKIQFTASASLHDKLRRAQDLLRHRILDGDVSQVFELALNTLVERLEKQRFAATDRPRASRGVAPGSRAIPADVKRAVWERDGGRCAFIGNGGRRCRETGFLEFHHVVPYARGGEATVTNIALRCRSHNQYEAKLEFGVFDPSIVRESNAAWEIPEREPSAPFEVAARESSAPREAAMRESSAPQEVNGDSKSRPGPEGRFLQSEQWVHILSSEGFATRNSTWK